MRVETLHIELLHACPLKCLACDHRLLGGARLSLEKLGPVLRSPVFRDLRLISFSGGEPALHPELGAIIKAAAGTFSSARLILLSGLSEGSRLENTLKDLTPSVLSRLHIGSSLDGPGPIHDAMRGRAASFARLKTAHARIKTYFPQVSTGFTFTATAINAAYFYEAWKAAGRELGAPLSLQFLVPNANTSRLELKAADKGKLAAGLESAIADRSSAIYGISAPGLTSALLFLKGKNHALSCGAGKTFLMLSPEGRFYLCPFHKEITASLPGISGLRARLKGPGLKACASCFLRCARP
ncbi:MAG: hypothetical protein A2021_01180 [Elusimicrobia bacterium GWF2_52_66]|nr:MAG: hypothetical protein A2X33_06035 [Elusimicrobia bacterium GWA2_51_34]OGR88206.1 MAG: hypothetical protein A2021_01180 [Elusimicrobia bacterium GWF2_52_66]HAF95411.1 hypothetical protein [Elusimicrobiota bacterium]HCE98725.1 hypothetical protein [Elusimicrobiota bacterium]